MTRAEVLAWARTQYARTTDPQDRDFYAGVIDECAGTFDHARCRDWRVPRDEPAYCEGRTEAWVRLEQGTVTIGRMQHGGAVVDAP